MKTTPKGGREKEQPEDRWRSLLRSEQELLRQRLSLRRLGENLLSAETAEEDAAALLHEEYISDATQRSEAVRLREIGEALGRLQQGAYGRCEECGEEIPPKRLQAVPWARYCVPCQEDLARDPAHAGGTGGENGVPW